MMKATHTWYKHQLGVTKIPWFNVDDGFANSKPVLRIPRRYRCAALGLWTLAGSWSAKELTDGFIPDHAIEEFAGTSALAEWLVRAGLWRKVEGGWQFEGWSKWQKTKENVLAYREREAEKKRQQRSKPKDTDSDGVSPGDSPGTETSVPEGHDRESQMCPGQPLPTPLPTPKEENKETCATALRASSPRFADFWSAYPRRRDRRKAEKAFAAALKRADAETIIAGAHSYAMDPNRMDEFTKYAEGWLNGDGWLDEPLPARNGSDRIPASDRAFAMAQALKTAPSIRLELEP